MVDGGGVAVGTLGHMDSDTKDALTECNEARTMGGQHTDREERHARRAVCCRKGVESIIELEECPWIQETPKVFGPHALLALHKVRQANSILAHLMILDQSDAFFACSFTTSHTQPPTKWLSVSTSPDLCFGIARRLPPM